MFGVKMRRLTGLFCVFVVAAHFVKGETHKKLYCHDSDGNEIPEGTEFIPDLKDPCQTCRCDRGFAIMCTSVSCSAPACEYRAVEGKCCEFICLDKQPGEPNSNGGNGTGGTRSRDLADGGITNLGLRLVASTITSFLVLALLLFMIHKLRQRRLMMAVRRLNSSRRRLEEVDNDRYLPDGPPLGMSVPPYQDPPPPYSPPKPSHAISHGEPPPPYEAIDNNNYRNTLDHLDLPPEYDGRICNTSSPVAPAGASPDVPSHHDLSYTSATSASCAAALPDSRFQTDTHRADMAHNFGSAGSIENTRVKEVFSNSLAGERLGNSSLNTTMVESEDGRNLGSGPSNEDTETSPRISQNWVNVFGPRCIKKSGSVEIVRQSISPRNSYYMEGVDAMSQSLDPAVLNRILYGVRDEESVVGGSSRPFSYTSHHNSSLGQASLHKSRENSGGKMENTQQTVDRSQRMENNTANDRRRQFRLSSLLHSPVESTESPVSSPISPTEFLSHNPELRSNSITSDLSWLSVCSETGEPRKSKNRAGTNVIQNDSQYPDMPNLSRYLRSEIECSKALSLLRSACGTEPNDSEQFARDHGRPASREDNSVRASVGSVGDVENSLDSLDHVPPVSSTGHDTNNIPRSNVPCFAPLRAPTDRTDGYRHENERVKPKKLVCDRKPSDLLPEQDYICSCKTCQLSGFANSGPWERSDCSDTSQGDAKNTKQNSSRMVSKGKEMPCGERNLRVDDKPSSGKNKRIFRSSGREANSKSASIVTSTSASAIVMGNSFVNAAPDKMPARQSYPRQTNNSGQPSLGNSRTVITPGDDIHTAPGVRTLPCRPPTVGKVATPRRDPHNIHSQPADAQGFNYRRKSGHHTCSAPLCSDV